MRVTIEGVRRWILVTAALLLAVVAGFFLYGRNRFRHIEKDLPARLGLNIQQTASGYSVTKTSQGHTLFTLKASKLVQLKAGHALLHDVDITLYGPPGSGRQDRIQGSDFDYNQNDGVATSQGDVEIELQGVTTSSGPTSAGGSDTIRVKTKGLTFVQKSAEASTAGRVEFQLPRASGNAVGADYDAKTGVVILNSQVHITTSSNGKPSTVEAGHATILRDSQQALLVNARLEYETANGRADEATVYFRKDGTTEKVDAQGHVQLHSNSGGDVDAQTAEVLFNLKSQPLQAVVGGGVQFASSRPNSTMRGSAQEGTLLFAAGAPNTPTSLRHAEFRRDVRFDEQSAGLQNDPQGRMERQVEAGKLNVDFARQTGGRGVEAQKAIADESPVVTMRQMPSKRPAQSMRISGDELVATLAGGNRLRTLDGTGNTQVVNESSDGSRDTTHGDMLHATFAEAAAAVQPKHSAKAAEPGRGTRGTAPATQTTLETVVQDGHVMLTETPAKKPGDSGPPATLTGWAQHAEYHAGDQVLQMTGHPRMVQGEAMQLSAEQIEYHRDTQNAEASGNVKVTYTQAGAESAGAHRAAPAMGGSGPVHVIADRAMLDHASNQSLFYGAARSPARMWQDSDSLLAPVIAIDRSRNVLKAWGDGTGAAPVVDVNFAAGSPNGKRPPAATEVHSRTLVYSDNDRIANFQGSVTAEQGDAAIHADEARLYLKPKSSAEKPAQTKSGQRSQLDHLVATGHVVFTEPGRKGQGEKLVYTADEEKYVLTGTPAEAPRLWDRTHGTTTGAALVFFSQNDKVQVVGGKSGVVTETQAPR
ncbi:MAG TPA: LptA/OstA family protein [Acidobacteriaceae bacterium]|jgi:lipopolysaccharide export system protein LptA|nr:LptA/OstA family protein [Acidobacteriaceae bacterium]